MIEEHGKTKVVKSYLDSSKTIQTLEELLPTSMKGQGKRLLKRALLTFSKMEEKNNSCPPPLEYVRIVLQAAELGLAIDGRYCYAIPYKGVWTCVPDYKGLIAVARRCRVIEDVELDIICENDQYQLYRHDGRTVFRHERPELGQPRGKTIGAYCRLFFPNGRWKVEVMDISELNAIKVRSASKNGPWRTDESEMQKKTVCRRALKLYGDDDSTLAYALSLGGDEIGTEESEAPSRPVGKTNLRRQPEKSTAEPEPDPEYPDVTPEQASVEDKAREVKDTMLQRIGEAETDEELEQAALHDDWGMLSDNDRREVQTAIGKRNEMISREPGEEG